MSLVLTTRQTGNVTIVEVAGRITLGDGASTLREAIRLLAEKGYKNILLNLAEVSYIDSSGLGALVSAFATVNNHGGHLKLLNVIARIKDLLLLTKLYSVFDVYDNEVTALRSFAEPSSLTAPIRDSRI